MDVEAVWYIWQYACTTLLCEEDWVNIYFIQVLSKFLASFPVNVGEKNHSGLKTQQWQKF